ncbi:ABC transporter ATP-binding protein [Pseudalkalibacillus salsuginis]|uniref:ABC transporter ATP-binding protein n=1 Tax=Pseudalkalibacillus salsuginis TaxID=2910972 RepID=UPI001F4143A0|nr:ABC transporter ATP-binding protein [Pseudalkalibacillus salsuginis]MCF6410352.1 ABC transporter ATP-binding protein [Pseudalkalibacillus salsuginis]
MKLLEVQNLKVSFRSRKEELNAIDDISFSINKGETVALIGESGSGKSVTSLSVLGLLPKNGRVVGGHIFYENKDLLRLGKKELGKIRGKQISMIFQDASISLNPSMKIGKQITQGLAYHRIIARKELKREALRLLAKVGFHKPKEVFNQYPGQLSGGMKQRVLITMAISCNPQLIIADEPTTALDVTTQKQILDLMNDYKQSTNTSILLITHDFGLVAEYADRVMVMFGGKIVEAADVFTLFKKPIHPYTKGLMNSIPKIEEPRNHLQTIKDAVIEETAYEGRIFAPETFSADEKVYHSPSTLIEVEPGHHVRFFNESSEVLIR